MKNLITAAIIAISANAAQANTLNFEYAEGIAKQAQAAEACIADVLENLTPSYAFESLGGETYGEVQAGGWRNGSTHFTDKERLERFARYGLYELVLSGDIKAEQTTQALADVLACVPY